MRKFDVKFYGRGREGYLRIASDGYTSPPVVGVTAEGSRRLTDMMEKWQNAESMPFLNGSQCNDLITAFPGANVYREHPFVEKYEGRE